MANTFSVNLFPRILAGALEVFVEELEIARKVNKDFRGTAGQLGQTVSVSRSVPLPASDVTPDANAPTLTDFTPEVKLVTIDRWKQSRFHITEKEATELRTQDQVPFQIAEAARALANEVNSNLWSKYVSVFGFAGIAGTPPFSAGTVDPAADVREVLNQQLCPDIDRTLIVGLSDETDALKSEDLKKMLNAGDPNALRRGVVGNLFNFEVRADRARVQHVAGTGTGYLVDNAAGYPVGTTVLTVGTGTGTILDGDIITFAGHTQTYAVQSLVSTTLTLYNPLVTAVIDTEALTVTASHDVNLAFDPRAFALVMRIPPSEIEGAPTFGQHFEMTEPNTGIPMRLDYLPGYHATQWELSILYGAEIIDDRCIARLAG